MPKIIAIIIFAFLIRFYGINWDAGFHLHPDERMLIMVAERINFFAKLNPQFFNYGSLPIYLLKAVSQIIGLDNYQGMLYAGRYLSIFFDLLTIFLIYKISKILFKNDKVALFSSFFYAIAFFPIQNSHFYTVDVVLTSLTTLLVYISLRYLMIPSLIRPSQRWYYPIIMFGGVFGAMLATKFTAIIFLLIIIAVLIFNSRPVTNLFWFGVSFLIFNFIFMPYAFLDYKNFLSDVMSQIKMNNNPYIFPYTLQYVGSLPYLYYLKNIFLWGLGPIISTLSLVGLSALIYQKLNIKYQSYRLKFKTLHFDLLSYFFIFYFLYFIIIGQSAVKFMRYMLPMYPFFAIMAGFGFYQIQSHPRFNRGSRNSGFRIKSGMTFLILFLTLLWTLMFINIYSQPNTRISATEWILKNVPAGSTLAVEHWDDRLPLYGSERYRFVELTLYDQPDSNFKWNLLNQKLKQSDYIIIASNRLYAPLQKLSDCSKYKLCYPKTAEYYRRLFSAENVILGNPSKAGDSRIDSGQARMTNLSVRFKKIAEFFVYPGINDQGADESFTVYDHPKIMIFKQTTTPTR